MSEGNPLLLAGLTVPGSLAELLQGFRSCCRLRPFEVFCLLAVGMVTQTGLCTVTGMLIGTGMQTMISHHRAHRFFSAHAWSADQLGLAMARLIVATWRRRAPTCTWPSTTAGFAAAALASTARSGPTTRPSPGR